METEIDAFITYLQYKRKKSENTVISYRRDLLKIKGYMEEQGITDVRKITLTHLNSYLLFLEMQEAAGNPDAPGDGAALKAACGRYAQGDSG